MAGKHVNHVIYITLVVLLALVVQTAGAVTLDLTTAGASGTINNAIYVQFDPQSTGTGVIDSFVEVSGSGGLTQTEAYNTTTNNVLNNGSADNFNHSITIGDVPIVDIGGTSYRQFLLDINENNNAAGDQFISLDDVQIFVGGTANAGFNTFTGGILDHDGTLVYHMDGAPDGDSWVALDYALNAGSGSGDMFLYVPVANFAGFSDGDVVTLYSHFGAQGIDPAGFTGNFNTSDGFEEWAVLTEPQEVIPEPTTLSLMGLGLAGLFVHRARRKRAE